MKNRHHLSRRPAACFVSALLLLLITSVAGAAVTYTTIFEFPGAAAKPGFAVVKASDGNFYGTTAALGAYGKGAIYRVTPQGQITTIYSFKGEADGTSPSSGLVQGPDGNLYGTTSFNDNNAVYGTVYQVTLDGTLTTLHSFTGPDGQFPAAELVDGGDGKLYGTVRTGKSPTLYGAIYSITPSGTFNLAYSFKVSDPGGNPAAALIKGNDGFLYGTTSSTPSGFNGGTVFKFDPATSAVTTIYNFNPNTDGFQPGKLVQGSDGNFYGTTAQAFSPAHATAFKVTPTGTFTVLHVFDTAANGYPGGVGLVQASDGNFYGTCINGGDANNGVIYQLTPAGDFKIVYAFNGSIDGSSPHGPLLDGGDGFLYGVTAEGAGDREAVFRGDGTFFKFALNDDTLALFTPFASAPLGKDPEFPLIATPEGNVVGIAKRGGEKSFGTFFSLSPTGEFTDIYNFDPDLRLFHPVTLGRAGDGAFYGINSACLGCGLAPTESDFFKVTTAGAAAVIDTTGSAPPGSARLATGPDGALYGMNKTEIVRVTTTGQVTALYQFQDTVSPSSVVFTPAGKLLGVRLGTVFVFDPSTGALTTVYTFKQGEGGGSVNSPLTVGADGNFYGTTQNGGTNSQGSVFKVTPTGEFTVLYSFTSGADGGQPAADLIQATDGNFYGTTEFGGTNQGGTIFSIPPSGGAPTTLYNFDVPGGNPTTPLTQAKDGSFYGVTADGGVVGNGTIYRLVVDGVPPQASPAQLLNISTRMEVLTGNNVLIGGFIVTGTDQKKVLVRGLGPSLPLGAADLADPTLELHDANTTLQTNDNWKDSQRTDIEATGIPPSNDAESALVATLPGNNSAYTAILAGKNGGTGVGLVEVYDLAQSANSKLANISTRGFVDTGDNVMIGGLILGPNSSGAAKVLVRAIGPSLSGAGVANPLQDPTLELRDVNGQLVAQNDDWKLSDTGGSQQAAIEATTIPPTDDHESALVRILNPGNYTAIVRGKADTTGVALVELYNLP